LNWSFFFPGACAVIALIPPVRGSMATRAAAGSVRTRRCERIALFAAFWSLGASVVRIESPPERTRAEPYTLSSWSRA
jgi:hypothetical protein